jgi:menaquinol-cytochrome c reductase iron-sulfur subunit
MSMPEIQPPPQPTRRSALQWASFIFGGLATTALAVPILGYYLSPFLRRSEDAWVDVGAVKDFPQGETRMVTYENPKTNPWDGLTAKAAAYVRNDGGGAFTIFAVNCAHLGCPVSWFPQSGLFLCPCHGGVYYADGSRASGPPPRGLYTYDYEVADGRLRIKAGHMPTLQDTMKNNEA